MGSSGGVDSRLSCPPTVHPRRHQRSPPPQELLDEVDSMNGRFLVTSDHGNADDMAQVGGEAVR